MCVRSAFLESFSLFFRNYLYNFVLIITKQNIEILSLDVIPLWQILSIKKSLYYNSKAYSYLRAPLKKKHASFYMRANVINVQGMLFLRAKNLKYKKDSCLQLP